MSDKISLQEFADDILDPEDRQQLKTPQEVADANGWTTEAETMCCGARVLVSSILDFAYYVRCATCGKFASTVAGEYTPFLDGERIDLNTESRWYTGLERRGGK
jgi:hypothetical protein